MLGKFGLYPNLVVNFALLSKEATPSRKSEQANKIHLDTKILGSVFKEKKKNDILKACVKYPIPKFNKCVRGCQIKLEIGKLVRKTS